jgi:shikimate dehydrogenase
MDGTYEARSVDEDGVRFAYQQMRAGELHGANVTMPHKALAFSLCDDVDPEAARAGSVNTVVAREGKLVGYSTDIDGIRSCWDHLPPGRPVLVLGGGGAAAAALVALADRGPFVSTRHYGQGLVLGRKTAVEVGELRWGVPLIEAIIVNCTPLGMRGESLPEEVLALANGLFDMAYAPTTTPAVTAMRRRGVPVVEGLDLLVSQAWFGFRLFTGVSPPLEVMRLAAEKR